MIQLNFTIQIPDFFLTKNQNIPDLKVFPAPETGYLQKPNLNVFRTVSRAFIYPIHLVRITQLIETCALFSDNASISQVQKNLLQVSLTLIQD